MITKKTLSKFSIGAIIIALLVVAGGASAFFLMNKTPKQAYFYSEIQTSKHINNLFEQRYQNELKWRDIEKKSVTEHTYDLSAEVDNYGFDLDDEVATLINSATATFQVTTDPKNRQAVAEVSASIANTSIDGIKAFITPEKLLVTLPFIDEWIQLKDEEFGKLFQTIYDIDATEFTGNEKLGLSNFMKEDAFLSEEDKKYLQKEYIEFLYHQLPDKAFTSVKENINVYDKKMQATKISMNLSENDVKSLLTSLLEKAKNDKKLHSIMEKKIEENNLLSQYYEDQMYTELADFTKDFKMAMTYAIKNMDSLYLEDGLQSTIWEVSDLIVKRDALLSMGSHESNEFTLSLKGKQLPDTTEQKWDYTLKTSDDYDTYSIDFSGALSWENNQSDDYIEFMSDDFSFIYEGEEALKKKEREFSRSLRFSDGYDEFYFDWDGTATHEKDSKLVHHTFSVDIDDERVGLNLTDHSKIVKKIELPSEKVINLGDMNSDELEDFLLEDIQDDFQNWIESLVNKMERFF